MSPTFPSPRWTLHFLLAAGICSKARGTFAVVNSGAIFLWLELPRSNRPQLRQCIGMNVFLRQLGPRLGK